MGSIIVIVNGEDIQVRVSKDTRVIDLVALALETSYCGDYGPYWALEDWELWSEDGHRLSTSGTVGDCGLDKCLRGRLWLTVPVGWGG